MKKLINRMTNVILALEKNNFHVCTNPDFVGSSCGEDIPLCGKLITVEDDVDREEWYVPLKVEHHGVTGDVQSIVTDALGVVPTIRSREDRNVFTWVKKKTMVVYYNGNLDFTHEYTKS